MEQCSGPLSSAARSPGAPWLVGGYEQCSGVEHWPLLLGGQSIAARGSKHCSGVQSIACTRAKDAGSKTTIVWIEGLTSIEYRTYPAHNRGGYTPWLLDYKRAVVPKYCIICVMRENICARQATSRSQPPEREPGRASAEPGLHPVHPVN